MRIALVALSALAAIAVSGASAADFESDAGPCTETPGENALLRCTTAYVGMEYEVEIESEEGSGCTSPGNPYVWMEIKNGSLPAGLSMSRAGVISGTPSGGPGLARFWVWNHDLTFAQGGPDWCQREDRSEREFSIPVDPGLVIDNDSIEQAVIGRPYTETFTATRLVSLNPPTGPDAPATWSLESGALPPGLTLSKQGELAGTPTAEGSWSFVVRAQDGTPIASETYTLSVRQPLAVRSPFAAGPRPTAEVGVRVAKILTATGGSGTYTWSLASGALPTGLTLDASRGALAGIPRAAGPFAFGVTATDSEGRVATVDVALRVAPRLAIKTSRLTAANVGVGYRATLATVGGVGPLRWSVVRGRLPANVRLSQSLGALAGTPSRAGTYRVTVQARDALGAKAQRTLVLVVT